MVDQISMRHPYPARNSGQRYRVWPTREQKFTRGDDGFGARDLGRPATTTHNRRSGY